MAITAFNFMKERTVPFEMFLLALQRVLLLAECAHQFHFVDDLRVGTRIVLKWLSAAKGTLIL
jgi:hypothetical protein